MANNTVDSSAPRKRGGWLKKLGLVAGILVALLIVAYFVVTSSGFFKSVILPKVSKSLGAEVTVSDASISPFSQVILHNLKVQTAGMEPLVTATEVVARYNLRQIMGGNIQVDELTMTSPTVTIVENPDGTSNLDPILKSQKSGDKPADKSARPPKPAQIDIRKVALNDATIRAIESNKAGEKEVIEISHLNVGLENLKNGATGKLTVNAGLKEEKTSPKPDAAGGLEAKVAGEYSFSLSADLAPTGIKGSTKLDVSRAEGAMSDIAGAAVALNCDLTPTDIKELSLSLQKGTQRLGEARVSGPFSAEKKEGKLTVEILSIDHQLLNLAGAKTGMKFGTTTINSTNQIELAKGGTLITALGKVDVSKFQMKRGTDVTPTLDFHSDYDVVVDVAQSFSTLRVLTLTGLQSGNQLLRGELTSPMRISWGSAAGGEAGDSTFTFTLTGLNLPDWKPFIGDAVSSGKVSAQAKVSSQKGGKDLTFDVASQIDDLSARFGSNSISQAGIALALNGQATDMKQHTFKNYSLKVSHRKDPVLSVSGSGTYNKDEKDGDAADLQLAVQLFLPRVMDLAPQPGSSLSSGTVDLKGHLVQKGKNQSITGNLVLSDLTGNFGSNQFRSFGATADLDVAMNGNEVDIRKATGKVTEGGKAGGNFDLSGKVNSEKKTAQLTAKLSEFNENGLRFAFEPMLADKKLVTIALSANTSIQYDANASSAIKGDLQVSKLVVSDPKKSLPGTPLEAKMQFDIAMRKQVTDIHQFQLTLTPTSRGKNEIQLTGQVDATVTNAITGNLKLTADTVDVTSFYDLFADDKKTPASTSANTSSSQGISSAPAKPDEEPPAMQLPLKNFVADATIHKLFLREIEVSDAHATVKIDGGHVVINPFKLGLNGAPVNSTIDLDMGVPGYKYDVTFGADRVPLAPFVNSFTPERKGQIGGTLIANAAIKGQGTTGASLQKNLSGKFDLSSTNLNLAVVNIDNRVLKTVIDVVAGVPELIRNPAAGAVSIVSGLLGLGKGGLSAELSRSPVDAILVNGQMGAGQVKLSQAEVRSVAFLAQAGGEITLAPVLTNSALRLPLSISVSRAIANQLSLPQGDTPTNAPYVKLPDFATVKGTVGVPKTDVDKAKLVLYALQIGKSAGSSTAGNIGNIVGGFLGNNSSTNSAGSNQPAKTVDSLLQGIGGFLNGGATNTNAPSNGNTNRQVSPADLLDGLLKQKK